MNKICTVCKEEKPFSQFYNRKLSSDGKFYRCKTCDNKAHNKYREKHKERFNKLNRNRVLKNKYGIDQEDYDVMLKEQDYVCAICGGGQINNYVNFSVDHCHNTGKVRGLLCQTCNQGLGLFKENIITIQNAIKYLEKFETKEN